jgi:hypothetical protein
MLVQAEDIRGLGHLPSTTSVRGAKSGDTDEPVARAHGRSSSLPFLSPRRYYKGSVDAEY